MTEFKFFDKKQNKFISPFRGPENIWNKRYDLGIFNNSILNDNLKKMIVMNKKNKKTFEIYVKHNKKFVIATDKVIDEILNPNKNESKMNNKVVNKKKKKGGSRKSKLKSIKRKNRKVTQQKSKKKNKLSWLF